MNDYDSDIEYLTNNPEEIFRAWVNPWHNLSGSLFMPIAEKKGITSCLTAIQGVFTGVRGLIPSDLMNEIEELIPAEQSKISIKHLANFKKMQEKCDEVFGLDRNNDRSIVD